MNKNNFINNNSVDNQNKDCLCSTNRGLFIPNRQLSCLVMGLLFFFFFSLVAGFFLGKKHTIKKAFSAACHNNSNKDMALHNNEIKEEGGHLVSCITNEAVSKDIQEPKNLISDEHYVAEYPEATYCAKLISFGTEKAANKFVQKLFAKDIIVELKKHTSKSAKGRVINWYQVVTIPYSNRDELEQLVHRLIKEEMLSGVQIEQC